MARRPVHLAIIIIGIALFVRGSAAAPAAGYPWAWGVNANGELGNGTITKYGGVATPGVASDLVGVVQMVGGNAHTLALRLDGSVWAWGNSGWGQLGQGGYGASNVPVPVHGLGVVTAIAAGWAHSLALQSDGTVWAWGFNYYGQVGNGTSGNNILSPTRVIGLNGVVAVAAGSGGFTSLALKNDGTVWAWGYNGLGQLGNGTSNENAHPVPSKVLNLTGVQTIAAGSQHGLAVRSDGTLWAWGSNSLNQLGITTTTTCSAYHYPCSRVPAQVRGLTGAVDIAGGGAFSLALKSDGTVWGWGDNGYGQLGNGTTSFGGVRTPVRANLSNVAAIAAGDNHSLLLTSGGMIGAAGYNGFGQLGNGTFNDSTRLVKVSNVSGATAIGAGQNHSLAVASAPQ